MTIGPYFWHKFLLKLRLTDFVATPVKEYTNCIYVKFYSINGYYFEHDQAYRPLLDPPAPGHRKYDQILALAQQQLAQENTFTNKWA